MDTKVCTKCGSEKPLKEFHKDKQKKDGYYSSCAKCSISQSKLYARAHRKEVRLNNMKYTTGISKEIYAQLSKEQDNVCAICGRSNVDPTRNLSVDHCHDTRLVRGLLCTKCNFGLGYFNDDEVLLLKAIDYLKSNMSVKGLIHKDYQYARRKERAQSMSHL